MAPPSLPKSLDKPRRELTKFWLRFRKPAIAGAVVVAVLVTGSYAWQLWRSSTEEARKRETESTARRVAQDVGGVLADAVAAVEAGIEAAEAATLFARAEPQALRAAEQAMTAALPRGLGVRLIPPDVRDPDSAAIPPVTYASLEMMRSAAGGGTPRPEVLLLGEEEQHIALLRAVRSAQGSPLGYVLAGLDVALLSDAVARVDLPSGYVELNQRGARGRAVVGHKGNAGFRQGTPALSLPVKGSRLLVNYWAPTAVAAGPSAGELPVLRIAGALVVVLAAGAFVVIRRRKSAPAAAEPKPRDAVDPQRAIIRQKLSAIGGDAAAEVEAPEDADAPAGGETGPIQIPDAIFRAYDVRGVVGETLTEDVVRQLGRAIGSEAYDRGQQTLCVGRDGRASSPQLSAALVEGLRASGRDVIDVGQVPTPVLYFATFYLETGSGVMITGSHNPPQYNGLKIMIGGDTLFSDQIQGLKKRMQKGEFVTGAGKLQSIDISADYIRRVTEDVPVALGNAFKVVIDCGNGVAGDFAPKLVRALGHDVVELYCDVNGTFPNHHPDPSQPENLEDLIAAVKENDADLGFAFDGDGDRLGVVDANGRIVWPDAQMMLFARDVISRNAGAEIVFDVKCSSRLGKVVAKLGGKPIMFKTGHSHIKNKLKETGAPLAGEMSGHIFFKERWYGFDDAMYAAARMLEILMGFKQKPADVFAKLPAGVSTPELRVDMDEGDNLRFMETLTHTDQFGDATVTTIDGVRADWKDRWGLVRASNTTPSLVLRFEGDDEQALERVKDTFRKLLLEKKSDLSLPF